MLRTIVAKFVVGYLQTPWGVKGDGGMVRSMAGVLVL